MLVLEKIADFRRERARREGTCGFVPTMGYLHEGHLALVRRAAAENDHVVVSIFVNPTQFGQNEDFGGYPRDLARDLEMLHAFPNLIVFTPTVEEIYPHGFQSYVQVEEVSQGLEGERRPTHFRGVATVVAKLFNIVQPQRAYFGQKDAQQLAVIRQMVRDLAFPLEVIGVPTVRESDGLALSSRNSYLTPEQRAAAPVLYRALCAARDRYTDGERDAEVLRAAMRAVLAAEPLAAVDYVSAADAETLRECEGAVSGAVLLSMAVRIGRARLIDNLSVGVD
ncbi:MAG: pantoate--beta-alanine ligase [Chloroflexi bacterium CFX4]|nr:pantoate--beta-alanine ligase [Chloroflexi bacterium CFX4]MDL1923752.1 pantoate--beta-alanine ligase [Chloroflexi bacterium CFX3]